MRTTTIRVNAEKGTAHFNIYFSLGEIYNNNRTKSENTMILYAINCTCKLTCVYTCVCTCNYVSQGTVCFLKDFFNF